eukprot:10190877-Lingulodinium_polyedra.AAC.1
MDFNLMNNWCDQNAEVFKAPLPPLRLQFLFPKESKEGPWSYNLVHAGKNKYLERMAEEAESQYISLKATTQAPTTDSATA